MITVEGLRKSFRDGRFGEERCVLDSVDLKVNKGEVVGLIGDSGCGKTTLAMIVMKLLRPDSGHIILDGEDITYMSQRKYRERRGRVQMVFQNPISSFDPHRTALWSLKEAYSSFDNEADLREMVRDFNLPTDILDRKPAAISGGELQRLSILRALASDPDYLVLDEPTSMLDLSVQANIMQRLMEHRDRKGMLLITHDLDLAECVCDRAYSMDEGKTSDYDLSQ